MRITIIGTSSGLASVSRNQSAILVEVSDLVCLLDAGEGTTRAMLSQSLDPNAVSSIVITHTHQDHCGGLAGLIQYMQLTGRTNPLSIFLPQESVETFQKYLDAVYLSSHKLSFPYSLTGWESGAVINAADCTAELHLTHHLDSVRTLAEVAGLGVRSAAAVIRAEGKLVVYSSDVQSVSDLDDTPRQADLLILECTHIGLDEIMEAVSEWRAKQVLLTHVPMELEGMVSTLKDMAAKWGIPDIQFASDGTSVVV